MVAPVKDLISSQGVPKKHFSELLMNMHGLAIILTEFQMIKPKVNYCSLTTVTVLVQYLNHGIECFQVVVMIVKTN
jgi:hypothetical protein